ncbi:hypothetical protein HF1_00740 [Mycoplasma haemofelis str. Langford 1]|uniref:Uncharacterized protein n=1 Tax=Mycoplasma haemofelis (strain Langford 1) TaxID=941640 RepID=E8ZKB6_MYCHL|nr:hypothetical protein [Mycoplasma haemofelis]CBY92082.1 hypothetical protein HF1_00740 [Mycoplasma haemofelis str. Langford 1]
MKAGIAAVAAELFNSPNYLQQAQTTHSSLSYDYSLFSYLRNRRSILNIPVTLYVFESYYKALDVYTYLDEYTFEDGIFVYDARNKSSLGNEYKSSPYWLRNLKKSYHHKYYGSRKRMKDSHGIYSWENVDWTYSFLDSNLSLSKIVRLEYPSSYVAFEPQPKRLVVDYNHRHSSKINLYSTYLRKATGEGIGISAYPYSFGKLKSYPLHAKKLFKSWVDARSCKEYSDKFSLQALAIYSNTDPGFDGVCDVIDLKFFEGTGFSSGYDSYRWTSPYAGFKRSIKNYWTNEYYYYLLGEVKDQYGSSYDLNGSYDSKTSWFVDYDNLFIASNPKGDDGSYDKFYLVLNEKKIRNWSNFLTASYLFDFELSLSVNGKPKKYKFTMQDVLDKKTEFTLDLDRNQELPVFSDISLSISKRDESSIKKYVDILKRSPSDFKFKVDESNLKKNKQVPDGVEFSQDGLEELYPSQLLDSNILKRFFSISNGNGHLVSISDEEYKKLAPKVEFDDVNGSVNVKYYDFLKGIDSEFSSRNLRSLPDFKHFDFDSLNQDDYLKQYMDLQLVEDNDLESKKEYRVVAKNTLNPEVQTQWENHFSNKTVFISGKENFGLIPNYFKFDPDGKYSLKNVKELFELSSSSKRAGLTLDDYKYEIMEGVKGGIAVTVTLDLKKDNRHYKGQKTYLFNENSYLSADESFDLARDGYGKINEYGPSSPSEKDAFKYAFLGLGGVLVSSVASLFCTEGLKCLKKPKYF